VGRVDLLGWAGTNDAFEVVRASYWLCRGSGKLRERGALIDLVGGDLLG